MLIYADTHIWNLLCDSVNAEELVDGLAARGAQLVLGSNVLYEMLKTFEKDAERGKELFRALTPYIDRGTHCLAEARALLLREADREMGGPQVDLFLTRQERSRTVHAIEDLSRGEVNRFMQNLVAQRGSGAQSVRLDLRQHLQEHPGLKDRLGKISEEALPHWLEVSMRGPDGRDSLQRQLAFAFGRPSDRQLRVLAKRLIAGQRYAASKALVRSSLYLKWRCAQRDSIRSDIPDDAYHTVNACYCDVFLTTEKDQASHAVLFNPSMRAVVYKGTEPLYKWIVAVSCAP